MVGGEGQEKQDGGSLGSQIGEPFLVEKSVLKPTESLLWTTHQLRPGWNGGRAFHGPLRRLARRLAFLSARSLASLAR